MDSAGLTVRRHSITFSELSDPEIPGRRSRSDRHFSVGSGDPADLSLSGLSACRTLHL